MFHRLPVARCRLAAPWSRRSLLPWPLFLLLFLVFLGGNAAPAKGADNQYSVSPSIGPGLPFAIADFDGDHRPDFASVQAGGSDFTSGDYWIQLRLSALGRQSIRLIAPAGGLVIEARDVNGDHAPDLVLSTSWFRRPVAVFINDGHGSFSRADLNAFSGAFNHPDKTWGSPSDQRTGAVGTPPRSWNGIWSEPSTASGVRPSTGWISQPSPGFLIHAFWISHAGRAPPSAVFSL